MQSFIITKDKIFHIPFIAFPSESRIPGKQGFVSWVTLRYCDPWWDLTSHPVGHFQSWFFILDWLIPGVSKGESSRSLNGSLPPLHNREENCQNCDGPFSLGHQCGDEEEVEDDAGDSDSEEEESYNEDLEPPVVRLLRTLSSLSDDDQKRAALDMLSQLNSKFNQI